MKRIVFFLASLLCLTGVSSFTVKTNESAVTNESIVTTAAPQDYCPKGYVCEATNCKGISPYRNQGINGISVYKNSSGDVIAYVPGHGHLRCYWDKYPGTDTYYWWFDANNTRYYLQGYTRR